MNKDKILKMVILLAAVVILAVGLSRFLQNGSMSLSEYARLQGISESPSEENSPKHQPSASDPLNTKSQNSGSEATETPAASEPDATEVPAPLDPEANGISPSSLPGETTAVPSAPASLTGASLNSDSQLKQRVVFEDGFYYEPVSPQLSHYITGVSYPVFNENMEDDAPEISLDDLRYVHILHYDFEGNPTEGELICNVCIAQDLVEIFYELYRNEYQLEKVLLIDEYDGDDNASMEDNNTSCFNYRPVTGSASLSRHALGLAIDINPLYNPYITYTDNGEEIILPASASSYTDRSSSFPYKIDENDLCYKLFIQHGFTWGGNWNSMKDYQHFQKAIK